MKLLWTAAWAAAAAVTPLTIPAACGAEATMAAQKSCCRICRAGKPCGNTCIARETVCRAGAGCACAG